MATPSKSKAKAKTSAAKKAVPARKPAAKKAVKKSSAAPKAAAPKVVASKPAARPSKQSQPKWVSDFLAYAQENPGMALVGGVAVLLAVLLIFG